MPILLQREGDPASKSICLVETLYKASCSMTGLGGEEGGGVGNAGFLGICATSFIKSGWGV